MAVECVCCDVGVVVSLFCFLFRCLHCSLVGFCFGEVIVSGVQASDVI